MWVASKLGREQATKKIKPGDGPRLGFCIPWDRRFSTGPDHLRAG